jgi:hypothetical protein
VGIDACMREAHAALAASRAAEAEQIANTIQEQRVLGILGEAEVGKTQTISQALRELDGRVSILRLDLERAASDGHVGFMLAKGVARALLPGTDLSLLSAGVLVPARVERRRLAIAEALGVEGMEEALREWPSGHYGSAAALRGVEALAGRKELIVWVDHVEAPRLTPRHPVDVERILWGIRELAQRQQRVRVVVSARAAAADEITGARAAFHQQGRWMSLESPGLGVWRDVARRVAISPRATQELAALTGGHPKTMLIAISVVKLAPDEGTLRAEDVLREVAAQDDGQVAYALQYARSLHRLGGQVLLQIASSQRPYAEAQRGSASTQEIRKVLSRLRMAGLIRPAERWALVNPLLAIRIRGTVAELPGIDDWEEPTSSGAPAG